MSLFHSSRVGLDFAATGIKVVVRSRGRNERQILPCSTVVPSAALASDLLRTFVRESGLSGCPARVALGRRDVLIVNLTRAQAADPTPVLPSAQFAWRWTVASFEGGGAPVLVAVSAHRLETFRSAVEFSGLAFDGAQFPVDPLGNGSAVLDIGAAGARIAFRNPIGQLQHLHWRNFSPALAYLRRARELHSVHLTGGGAFHPTVSDQLKNLGKTIVPPPSVEAAVFHAADLAMFGEVAFIPAKGGAESVVAAPKDNRQPRPTRAKMGA